MTKQVRIFYQSINASQIVNREPLVGRIVEALATVDQDISSWVKGSAMKSVQLVTWSLRGRANDAGGKTNLSRPSLCIKWTMALVFRLMFLTPSGLRVDRHTLQSALGSVKHGMEGYLSEAQRKGM